MTIILTGGTGYIGSAVLEQLVAAGHEVTALVRSEASAAAVAAAGASPVVGDILDPDALAELLAGAEGAIHTASPGDETSEAVDRSVASAVVAAFSGTTRPYVHTSGIWIYGDSAKIEDDGPFAPPALTAWRSAVEDIVLGADVAASIVAPGIVYGHGGGIPASIVAGPRTSDGAVVLIGSGEQHWATVHVDDLAELYVTVLAQGSALGYVVGASGDNPTVRELGEAVAGADGTAPESVEASRERLGALFADALLLDQQASGAKARTLGWTPTRPPLVTELTSGSYAG